MNSPKNTVFNPPNVLAALLSAAVFVIFYKYILQISGTGDYQEHIGWAINLSFKSPETFLISPWPLWHIIVNRFHKMLGMPPSEAAAAVSACFYLFSFITSYLLLNRLVKSSSAEYIKSKSLLCCTAAFALMFVSPYYVDWIFPNQYLGQFSPNPFHNPTQTAVIPLGLLCFAFIADIVNIAKNGTALFFEKPNSFFSRNRKSPLKNFKNRFVYIGFALSLFFSVSAKPSFAFVLLPSAALIWLWDLIKELMNKKNGAKIIVITRLKFALKLFIASVLSLLYILFENAQYSGFFIENASVSRSYGESFALSPPGAIWSAYSANIPLSIFVAMAFPILMCVLDFRYFLNSTSGRLSFLAYVAGVCQFLFLTQTGVRALDANFAWSMMSGMSLLFFTSTARLIHHTLSPSNKKFPAVYNMLIYLLWFLLFAHMFAGFHMISPQTFIL